MTRRGISAGRFGYGFTQLPIRNRPCLGRSLSVYPLASIPPAKEVEINLGNFDFFVLDANLVLNHQVGKLVSIDENETWIANAVSEAPAYKSDPGRACLR